MASMKYPLTHTTFPARPGLRPCTLDPAPPARRAPFGRLARFAADCLPSKIPCLTARLHPDIKRYLYKRTVARTKMAALNLYFICLSACRKC